MLAEQPVADAQRMLARAAELTGVVGDSRIDEHPVAGLHVRDAGTHRLDDPGAVGADDVRKAAGSSRQPFDDEQIEVIERGRANRDAHLARLRGGGVRDIDDLEVTGTASGGQYTGAHEGAP